MGSFRKYFSHWCHGVALQERQQAKGNKATRQEGRKRKIEDRMAKIESANESADFAEERITGNVETGAARIELEFDNEVRKARIWRRCEEEVWMRRG